MGERIRHSELVERWRKKKPRFFRRLSRLSLSGIAIVATINLTVTGAGSQHTDWWQALSPYLLGICAGIYAACTVTVDGGYRARDLSQESNEHTVLNQDIDHLQADSPEQ